VRSELGAKWSNHPSPNYTNNYSHMVYNKTYNAQDYSLRVYNKRYNAQDYSLKVYHKTHSAQDYSLKVYHKTHSVENYSLKVYNRSHNAQDYNVQTTNLVMVYNSSNGAYNDRSHSLRVYNDCTASRFTRSRHKEIGPSGVGRF